MDTWNDENDNDDVVIDNEGDEGDEIAVDETLDVGYCFTCETDRTLGQTTLVTIKGESTLVCATCLDTLTWIPF